MKTNPYLIDFYNNYDEDSRLALKSGSVEFLTTMRYIEKYINPVSYTHLAAFPRSLSWESRSIWVIRPFRRVTCTLA